MATLEETSALLDETMVVLTGNLISSTAEPKSGTTVLDSWLTQLRAGENTDELVAGLENLKTQLATDKPDSGKLSEGMFKLAEQTRLMGTETGSEGEIATRLEALSSALRTVAGALGNQ